jgi:Xaa-Pro aminopeptidase
MLTQLRSLLSQENIQGYIVPCSDEFQNEFVPDYSNRLKFLTGFGGSNGLLVVLPEIALFFTDGRYLEQAEKDLDCGTFHIFDISLIKNFDWSKYVPEGGALGYDPLLFTKRQIEIFRSVAIKAIDDNLVDKIWLDKPQKEKAEVSIYPIQYSGQEAAAKINQLKLNLASDSSYLITDTASICWLLNIRNKDQSCIGMVDCYLLINKEGAILFANLEVLQDIAKYFNELNIKVLKTSEIQGCLKTIATEHVLVDEATCPAAFLNILQKAQHNNYYKLFQACKNPAEIEGAKMAHINDAVAICEFFSWLEGALHNKEKISEFDLSKKLIALRKNRPLYIKESFHAICGYQANSSIIHYRPLELSARTITGSGMLLVDNGGHYYGGTTDVTRTVFLGQPGEEEKQYYTLVLKGHINLAKTKFKQGTSGQNLDVLARMFLWQNFADYPHSTGHGVGNFLNVHEGPQGISLFNSVPLQLGMILSNEPGYYKPGHFGIRVENLMYVKQSAKPEFFEFEQLTLIPYSSKLIDFSLLDSDERKWLASYYDNVQNTVRPLLSADAQKWLDKELCAIKL